VDAYFIQPRIFSHSVQLPAVLVMLAAISGGLLLGLVGAILAIPITAALLLLYREVLQPHLDRT
jgi:predicted PurR-regulated permease PerM